MTVVVQRRVKVAVFWWWTTHGTGPSLMVSRATAPMGNQTATVKLQPYPDFADIRYAYIDMGCLLPNFTIPLFSVFYAISKLSFIVP